MPLIYNLQRLKNKRQSLRRNMAPTEIMLWTQLRGRKLGSLKFRRQYSIGDYIVDFFCPIVRLAIEVDGDIHYIQKLLRYDRYRQTYLERLGITVLRFTNIDIQTNLDGVLTSILEKARSLLKKRDA